MKHYLTSRCVRGLQVDQMKYDLEYGNNRSGTIDYRVYM